VNIMKYQKQSYLSFLVVIKILYIIT